MARLSRFRTSSTSRASGELDSPLRDDVRKEMAQLLLLFENVHLAKVGNQEPRSWCRIGKIIDAGAQYNSAIRRHFEVFRQTQSGSQVGVDPFAGVIHDKP